MIKLKILLIFIVELENMSNELPYRSTIKSRSFFYIESKKYASLILAGLHDDELSHEVIENNLFQVRSEDRRREIARTIQLRLQSLDLFLQKQIVHNNLDTSKSVVLYSIIKTDQLFKEFMHEIIYDHAILKSNRFKDTDIDNYFVEKKLQSKTVNSWTDYTLYKLKQVYKKILSDAGFIQPKQDFYEITLPIIDPQVTNHFQTYEPLSFIHYLFGRK